MLLKRGTDTKMGYKKSDKKKSSGKNMKYVDVHKEEKASYHPSNYASMAYEKTREGVPAGYRTGLGIKAKIGYK